MSLLLQPADLAEIERHAVRTYPEECCGFLLGPLPSEPPEVRVTRVLAADNEREDSRHNRFVIRPEIVLQAHKQARAEGLTVLGYYHSHPDHPAEPSEFDREHAWPGLSYLIVSVRGGQVAEARSWRLRDDRGGFEPEAVATEALAAPGTPST